MREPTYQQRARHHRNYARPSSTRARLYEAVTTTAVSVGGGGGFRDGGEGLRFEERRGGDAHKLATLILLLDEVQLGRFRLGDEGRDGRHQRFEFAFFVPAVVDHLVFPSKFLRGFIGFFVDDPTRKTKGGRRQLRRRHVNEGVFLEGGGIEIRKRT